MQKYGNWFLPFPPSTPELAGHLGLFYGIKLVYFIWIRPAMDYQEASEALSGDT